MICTLRKEHQIQPLGTPRPPGAAAPLLRSLLRRLGGFAPHPPPRTLGGMNDDDPLLYLKCIGRYNPR